MIKFANSLNNIRLMDDLAHKETFIHKLHPLAKLLTTVIYLAVVMSFERYEIINIIPFVIYPLLLIILADIPAVPLLHRAILVLPFVFMIGIFNPIFDTGSIILFGITLSLGWISLFSLLIKCVLAVLAGLIFIATTRMEHFAAALRMLKVPRIFVLQVLLTYRYITVLAEEFSKMSQAYFLRSPGQTGIKPAIWGSFVGQLLLRSFDKAERIYQAMVLRGFNKEYNIGNFVNINFKDFAYITCWFFYFGIAKTFNIPSLIGIYVSGVIK